MPGGLEKVKVNARYTCDERVLQTLLIQVDVHRGYLRITAVLLDGIRSFSVVQLLMGLLLYRPQRDDLGLLSNNRWRIVALCELPCQVGVFTGVS